MTMQMDVGRKRGVMLLIVAFALLTAILILMMVPRDNIVEAAGGDMLYLRQDFRDNATSDYEDDGSLTYDPPTGNDARSCTIWVQYEFDNASMATGNITQVYYHIWWRNMPGSTKLGIQLNGTYNSAIDYHIDINRSNSLYFLEKGNYSLYTGVHNITGGATVWDQDQFTLKLGDLNGTSANYPFTMSHSDFHSFIVINPYSYFANASDDDGDGLNNDMELYTYGTDPKDPDTDNDGMRDDVEVAGSTSPLNPDTDNDDLNDTADPSNTTSRYAVNNTVWWVDGNSEYTAAGLVQNRSIIVNASGILWLNDTILRMNANTYIWVNGSLYLNNATIDANASTDYNLNVSGTLMALGGSVLDNFEHLNLTGTLVLENSTLSGTRHPLAYEYPMIGPWLTQIYTTHDSAIWMNDSQVHSLYNSQTIKGSWELDNVTFDYNGLRLELSCHDANITNCSVQRTYTVIGTDAGNISFTDSAFFNSKWGLDVNSDISATNCTFYDNKYGIWFWENLAGKDYNNTDVNNCTFSNNTFGATVRYLAKQAMGKIVDSTVNGIDFETVCSYRANATASDMDFTSSPYAGAISYYGEIVSYDAPMTTVSNVTIGNSTKTIYRVYLAGSNASVSDSTINGTIRMDSCGNVAITNTSEFYASATSQTSMAYINSSAFAGIYFGDSSGEVNGCTVSATVGIDTRGTTVAPQVKVRNSTITGSSTAVDMTYGVPITKGHRLYAWNSSFIGGLNIGREYAQLYNSTYDSATVAGSGKIDEYEHSTYYVGEPGAYVNVTFNHNGTAEANSSGGSVVHTLLNRTLTTGGYANYTHNVTVGLSALSEVYAVNLTTWEYVPWYAGSVKFNASAQYDYSVSANVSANITPAPLVQYGNETVYLDGSGSVNAVFHNWTWGDGNYTNGTASWANHTYGSEGNYTVTLNISTGTGMYNTTTASVQLGYGNWTINQTLSPVENKTFTLKGPVNVTSNGLATLNNCTMTFDANHSFSNSGWLFINDTQMTYMNIESHEYSGIYMRNDTMQYDYDRGLGVALTLDNLTYYHIERVDLKNFDIGVYISQGNYDVTDSNFTGNRLAGVYLDRFSAEWKRNNISYNVQIGLQANDSSVPIDNCTFYGQGGAALKARNSTLWLNDSTLAGQGDGVVLTNSSMNIARAVVDPDTGSLRLYSGCVVRALDSYLNRDLIEISNDSYVWINRSVTARLLHPNGSAIVSKAVQVTDYNDTALYSGTTNATGHYTFTHCIYDNQAGNETAHNLTLKLKADGRVYWLFTPPVSRGEQPDGLSFSLVHTNSSTAASTSQTWTLTKGWNLVGVSIQVSGLSAQDIFDSDTQITSIMHVGATKSVLSRAGTTTRGADFPLAFGSSYYVYSRAGTTVSISGSERTNDTIPVTADRWNLIVVQESVYAKAFMSENNFSSLAVIRNGSYVQITDADADEDFQVRAMEGVLVYARESRSVMV